MTFDTLYHLYQNSITSFADFPCSSIYGGESLTYREFADRVDKLRALFAKNGLKSGDKVVLLSRSMPNWAVTYFTVTISNMVIVPILPDFTKDDITKLILHSEAKAIVVSDKLSAKVSDEVRQEVNLIVRASTLAPISCVENLTPNTDGYSIPEKDSVAAIIYTSGTTSAPKGVMLTHYNLTSQIEMYWEIYKVHPEDVFLSILPLSHTYECSIGMIYPFRRGAQVVYIDKLPSASVLLPILAALRPTVMLVVPLIIDKIYRGKIKPTIDKSKLLSALYSRKIGRKLVSLIAGRKLFALFGGRMGFFGIGGSKLDTEVEQFLYDAHFPYAVGYGLTETSPLIAGMGPKAVRVGATGPALSTMQMRLDNVNSEGEGEIVVKGPNVMKGYFKNTEATRDAFTHDGWFRTRDLACMDKDGYLYIKGRIGNMIVGPSGENIYPEEIEFVINSSSIVNESLVKGDGAGRLTALVNFDMDALEEKYHIYREQISEKMEEIKKELLAYINQRVSSQSKVSKIVEIEEDFEKTPTQKIKRFLYNAMGKIDSYRK